MEYEKNSIGSKQHYRTTADAYNEAHSQIHEEMVRIVLSKVRFDENDLVVDVGGGTGSLTQAIYRGARLKRNVLCVDPNESMLTLALGKDGVTPLKSTAEEFFDQEENYNFDKALLIASIHHFPDCTAIFKQWAKWLRPGSICFILTRPPNTTLPFFRKALPLFEKSTADIPAMVDCLRHLGLKVEVSEEKMEFNMSKDRWYSLLRVRYMSHMHALSDQDIEEGIAELEREKFFDQRNITVVDNITAMTVHVH